MIKKKYKARVDNGKLILKEKDIFKKELIRYEGKEVTITIGPKDYSQRSIQQNRYYWGVVVKMLCEHTGHSDNEMHELMKCRFLKKRIDIKVKGIDSVEKIERYIIVKSSTALDTVGWEDYMDEIRKFAAEKFQLYIPLPNEVEHEY